VHPDSQKGIPMEDDPEAADEVAECLVESSFAA
jgi:hypothetical protein